MNIYYLLRLLNCGKSVFISGLFIIFCFASLLSAQTVDTINNLGKTSDSLNSPEAESLKILASNPTVNAQFGASMAIEGDTLVVGAPLERDASDNFRGAAYVFVRSGTSWIQQARLVSPIISTQPNFGTSVDISGDRIIIGAGTADDIPQPADFDGDGKAELAVFRASNGTWYVLNLVTNQFSFEQFGQTGDKPVVADYDGDGRADYAVYRNGSWYILRSSQGFIGIQFGEAADKPVPADYDGDGKADVAVFRPSNGTWYLNRSTAGFAGIAVYNSGFKEMIC